MTGRSRSSTDIVGRSDATGSNGSSGRNVMTGSNDAADSGDTIGTHEHRTIHAPQPIPRLTIEAQRFQFAHL